VGGPGLSSAASELTAYNTHTSTHTVGYAATANNNKHSINGHFLGQPGKPVQECLHSGFSWSKDDADGGDNRSNNMCKAPVK